jgi:hypothetical protein
MDAQKYICSLHGYWAMRVTAGSRVPLVFGLVGARVVGYDYTAPGEKPRRVTQQELEQIAVSLGWGGEY